MGAEPKKRRAGGLLGIVIAGSLIAVFAGAAPAGAQDLLWPVEGKGAGDLSSTFGPRLQASKDFAYDFHRGIDIPVPKGTPLRAVADGEVTIAGRHSGYKGGVVQIKHYKRQTGSRYCSVRGCFYSVYLHIDRAAPGLKKGQTVRRGQVVAYSGVGETSGYPHLHFEIRDEGRWQKDAVHPLGLLPHADGNGMELRATRAEGPDASGRVDLAVRLSAPRSQPDFLRITARVLDSAGRSLSEQNFDMQAWNAAYTPKSDPHRHLDDPRFNGIEIAPARFSIRSDSYVIDLRFLDLAAPPGISGLSAVVEAKDLQGHRVRLETALD